ncbi:hypothetical protein Tco_0030048, partial [Tanacetum coccineum]
LGIVAGERFAIELTPSTFLQRHFAGDIFPQRHVAGERVGMLLGKHRMLTIVLAKLDILLAGRRAQLQNALTLAS